MGASFNRILGPDCSGIGEENYQVHLVMGNSDGRQVSADHITQLCQILQ